MSRTSRLAVLALGVVGTGCGFRIEATGDDARPSDASIDGLPPSCENQGDVACDGRARRECGPDHAWLPISEVCDFACVAGMCVGASNVPPADVAGCGSSAPRLAPAVGSVTLTAPGGQLKVTCSDGCGDGLTEILGTRIPGTPGLGWFCLRSLEIPSSVVVGLPATGGPREAIAFIVDGTVVIAGRLEMDGGAATPGSAGKGAPGGDDGGGPAADGGNPGVIGRGACGGLGGTATGTANNYAAGGGGGAGHAVVGGSGGTGRNGTGGTAPGGSGGGLCGDSDLDPLVGGSGGGGGADGSCGAACGWPGGGGGGAIQISSRASISIAGQLHARGGAGYGLNGNAGGAGGGGAGGVFLLEAPTVSIAGTIIVDGGSGGISGAGAGGAGSTGTTQPGSGASATTNNAGGAGGGAAGGRVRIRSLAPTCGTAVSPVSACSTATLP